MAPRVPLRKQDSVRTGSASPCPTMPSGSRSGFSPAVAMRPPGGWGAPGKLESHFHVWIAPSCSARERLPGLDPGFGLARRASSTFGSGISGPRRGGHRGWRPLFCSDWGWLVGASTSGGIRAYGCRVL